MKNRYDDKIAERLKEFLKTENEWIPQYNNRFLPPFIMGRKKHNNKTGDNKFGSGITTYTSFGRKKRPPRCYFCDLKTEEEGSELMFKLRDLGVIAPLHTFPSVKIELSFAEANKLLSAKHYHKKLKTKKKSGGIATNKQKTVWCPDVGN